jgi:hypothetical protein
MPLMAFCCRHADFSASQTEIQPPTRRASADPGPQMHLDAAYGPAKTKRRNRGALSCSTATSANRQAAFKR